MKFPTFKKKKEEVAEEPSEAEKAEEPSEAEKAEEPSEAEKESSEPEVSENSEKVNDLPEKKEKKVPEVTLSDSDGVSIKDKKFKLSFRTPKQENEEKKSFLSGLMAKAEQMQRPSMQRTYSSRPKLFSVAGIRFRIKEYWRVLKITKKPTNEEFKTIVKASGLGIIIIGLVGFAIHMIVQTMQQAV